MVATILIIEDDPASLDLMAYLLRAHGFSALTASRGDEGVALLQATHPDLVICDIDLPGMDGYAIVGAVKSDPQLRTIPMMAVTALAMVGDREKVLAAGFDVYVTKPIDPHTFASHIESLLGGSAATLSVPQATAAVSSPSPPSRGILLVVDDCAVNRELKRSIFEPHGYRVMTAETVAAGLQLAHEYRPSAILTDVELPDGSGLDLLRVIKADARLRDIPVVVITSTHAEPAICNKSFALGAARFLVRPMDAARVLSEVESVLAQSP